MGRNKSNFVDLCQGDFGRKTAYTGVAQITTENVVQVLSDTIGTHNRNRMMINYLYRYYKGDQPILYREKLVRPEVNNRVVENHALEQVERLKTEFEQKKQERIHAEFAKKEQFKADKQQKLKDITEEGNSEVARRKEVEEKRKDIESQIEQTKKNISTLASEIAQKNQELEKLPPEPDMSGNEEYQAVVAEIQKKQEQLDGLTNNSEENAAVQAERMSAEKELTGIVTKIEMAKQAVQKQTETLERLNADRKKLGQEDSDIQQKLDMFRPVNHCSERISGQFCKWSCGDRHGKPSENKSSYSYAEP